MKPEIDRKKILKNLQMADSIFDMVYQIKSHQIKLKKPKLNDRELHLAVMKLTEDSCGNQ